MFPWHSETQLQAAIGESVSTNKPLVVVIGDSIEAKSIADSTATHLDAAKHVGIILRENSIAATQFHAVFPAAPGTVYPSLYVVRSGALVGSTDSRRPLNDTTIGVVMGMWLKVDGEPATQQPPLPRNLSAASSSSSFVHVEPPEDAPTGSTDSQTASASVPKPPVLEAKASKVASSSSAAPQSSASSTSSSTSDLNSDYTLISLKFGHDAVVRSKFLVTDTLQQIRAFVKKSGFVAEFDLVQPYPMKVFSLAEEGTLSLKELGLFPNGSLLVKKCVSKPVAYRTRKIESAGSSSSDVSKKSQDLPVYDSSALSIRFPDGSQLRLKFPASELFSTVRQSISEHETIAPLKGAFEVSQLYPARVFSVPEESQSLKDLDLLPSASLIVKPIAGGAASAYTNSGSTVAKVFSGLAELWTFLFGSAVALYAWILAQIGRRGGGNALGAADAGTRNAPNSSNSSENQGREAQQRGSTLAELRRRQAEEDKKKGNSTYNGNSTAQDF
ncbi:hypothetical protein CcCBS67573_g02087 [Chytriomyces confervae]|uniref:UBX domain-containing protein n=1 Tax=Chytriomyces confervae TaxID=246404 RepID=A0A507FJM5_9FUNG|nr:hypothetical protein CcCBS67573_g02087 [Chytriomyces confervae]